MTEVPILEESVWAGNAAVEDVITKEQTHEYVGENVTKTTFENGYVVYVNFSYANFVTPSGKFIPEREYRVMKVED